MWNGASKATMLKNQEGCKAPPGRCLRDEECYGPQTPQKPQFFVEAEQCRKHHRHFENRKHHMELENRDPFFRESFPDPRQASPELFWYVEATQPSRAFSLPRPPKFRET